MTREQAQAVADGTAGEPFVNAVGYHEENVGYLDVALDPLALIPLRSMELAAVLRRIVALSGEDRGRGLRFRFEGPFIAL